MRSASFIKIVKHSIFAAMLLAPALLQNAAAQANYSKPYSKSLQQKDGTRLTVKVDPSNRLVEEILYGADKSLLWRLVRELDEAYQPMSATKFDSNDQVLSRHKYLCLKGRIEEEELFNSRGTLLTRMQYFYDKKGRLDRIEHYNPQGRLLNITFNTSAQGAEPVMRDEGTTVIKVPTRK